MKTIFKYCIEHPKMVNLILILVLVMGMLAFLDLKRDSLPHVDFKMMFVTTVYPGASPQDVEVNVTIPLEEQIQKVQGIKEMNSYSGENFSNIFVELDPTVKNIEKIKDDVTKAVERVSFPSQVTERPVITELKSDIFPVFEVAVSGNHNVPELELRRIARRLEKNIQLLPGVGGTEKVGYRKREIHVEVDLNQIDENYVSLAEIMGAIRAANVRLSAGDLDMDTTKKKVVTDAEFDRPLDVRNVIVRSVFSGRRIRVSDIARVRDDFEKQGQIVKTNGEPSINIIVSKKENADAVTVANKVQELVDCTCTNLPPGIRAQVVKDYSIYVKSMLNIVIQNAMIGFVLVLLCLMIFLNPKVAFWTSLGIPFSLLVTFYFMPIYDISVTSISLLAIVIVLGMLVDDAIVVAEHIYSYREKGMNAVEAAVKGVSEIFWPVVATVTTTIAAFIPILLMGGIFGEWIRAIPIVVTVILSASLFESAFILPSHLAMTEIKAREKPKLLQILEKSYRGNLMRVLRRKYLVIGFFVVVFLFSVGVVLPFIGFELMPRSDQNILTVKLETAKGTPIEETERRVAMLEKIIEETVPQKILASYVTTIGKKGTELWESATPVTQSYLGRIAINLTPRQKRKITAFQIHRDLLEKFAPLKEKYFTELDVIMAAGGPPVGKAVDVTFIGNDDTIRTKLADEFYAFIRANPAVYDLFRNDEKELDELNIKLDRNLMAELGISAAEVAQVIRAAVDGNVVTSIRREGEEIDYRVMVSDASKKNQTNIRNLTIPNRAGKLIKLGSFIRFQEREAVTAFWHREGDRSVRVNAELDTDKVNPGEYNKMLKEKFEPMVAQYPDFRVEFGGLEQATKESLSDFFNALAIAIVVIYLILVVLFNSFTQPLIVMLAIPFGLIGVIFAFAVHWQILTFLGLIGILGLSGVVVNNSLVMLKFLNTKQEQICGTGEMLKLEHVVEAATRRFRPIVLTTLTTVAGLLPALYGFIGGKQPELFPLLLAIAWGLVFASLITLFLIPAIYLVERDFSCWIHSKFARRF